MGLPMARHLLTARHNVTVSDTDAQRLRAASLQGLTPIDGDSEDLESAVESAELIVSSLPHDAALLGVSEWVGAAARRGAIYMDTSTVSLQASAAAAGHCARRGIHYLRATVSGNNMRFNQEWIIPSPGRRDTPPRVMMKSGSVCCVSISTGFGYAAV